MVTLKEARIEAGQKRGRVLTQSEVAAVLEISRKTLGRWEAADDRVGKLALYALAYYYNIDVERFDVFSPHH